MPTNKKEEIIFSIMMVIVMVYGMICYNISVSTGGLTNKVFLMALKEMIIIVPIAFIIEALFVSKVASKKASQIVDLKKDNPFLMVIMMSCITVVLMCPIMSLMATILFKNAGSEIIAVWLQTTALNFPMALLWQLFFAGPCVRFIFRKVFKKKNA